MAEMIGNFILVTTVTRLHSIAIGHPFKLHFVFANTRLVENWNIVSEEKNINEYEISYSSFINEYDSIAEEDGSSYDQENGGS
ncbi:hypothetical protein QYM36_003184 [Artemia franciscana]|uniref:Uncharacterized protein n=1 Tax=Artemia franciscana TaxID=6661 RepID=A0AA88IJK6_ARTSF|nr:hypothetical protein QYM36_003184 [Artemia franciscana]